MAPEEQLRLTTVNKAGGTSMDAPESMLELAEIFIEKGESPYFVVSAVAGMTDALIEAMKTLENKSWSREDIESALKKAKDMIVEKTEGHIKKPETKQEVLQYINDHFEKIVDAILEHGKISKSFLPNKPNYKIRDVVIGTGERTSGAFLNGLFLENGIDSRFVDGIQIPDGTFDPERPLSSVLLEKKKQEAIAEAIQKADETREATVTILSGYVGGEPHGIAEDEERGYTDPTAADTAAALSKLKMAVTALRYCKKVKGVLSGHPNQLKEGNKPKKLSHASVQEIMELSHAGSELLNTRALLLAEKYGFDLELLDTDNPKRKGTRILASSEVLTDHTFKIVTADAAIDTLRFEIPQRCGNLHGFDAAIRRELDQQGLKVVNIYPAGTSYEVTIRKPRDEGPQEIAEAKTLHAIQNLKTIKIGVDGHEEVFEIEKPKWSKGVHAEVSVIGSELVDQKSTLANLTDVFAAFDANILGVSQNSGQRKITYLVAKRDGERIVNHLHAIFVNKNRKQISDFLMKRMQQLRAEFENSS